MMLGIKTGGSKNTGSEFAFRKCGLKTEYPPFCWVLNVLCSSYLDDNIRTLDTDRDSGDPQQINNKVENRRSPILIKKIPCPSFFRSMSLQKLGKVPVNNSSTNDNNLCRGVARRQQVKNGKREEKSMRNM
jgi:hypothetical protein